MLQSLPVCNQTNKSSLLDESQIGTTRDRVVPKKETLYSANKKITGISPKAVTLQTKVNEFFLFRVRMNI